MPALSRFMSLMRNLFQRRRADKALDAEVRDYVDMLAEEKMSAGMNPEEARRAARIEAGGTEQVKESVRDIRAGIWLDSLLQDFRFAVRLVMKNPGFALMAAVIM